MKVVLVLLDGLGDRSYKELKNRTPLQAASTPNLDLLSSIGGNGLYHASSPGQCLPSEVAHFLLFGYELANFPGRGLLEAVGENIRFNDNDVIALAHLAGVIWDKGKPILTKGRDDIPGTAAEMGKIFDALTPYETDGMHFRLVQTRRNDGVVIISGHASPFVSDTDPIIKGRPIGKIVALANSPEPELSFRTATAFNRYLSHCLKVFSEVDILPLKKKRFPNFLVTQRCGRRIFQEPFSKRWGFKGIMIASGSVYGGLAHELGIDFEKATDTDNPGGDLRHRIRLALSDPEHDFCHVHTKSPDEAAHGKDPERKKRVIESLDRGFDEIVRTIQQTDDLLVVITADHSTPSTSVLIHSGEPVPVTMIGPHVRRDSVNRFSETDAGAGCLGFLRGPELMRMILNYTDRAVFFSHRLGGIERPYFPEAYESFEPQ